MRFARNTAVNRSVNITPLIDVIFLLVLFFLLASVFARHGAIRVSAHGASEAVVAEQRPVALVRVAKGGVTDINGISVDTPVLLETLGGPGERQVVLLAKPGVSLQDYVSVLETLQGAGHNVRIGAAP
ncbi:MAG: biopolymer transporter ExbD [Rhodobiaceae bacterium]|nr:biopolymer transporter ExbD [Rhodobiaceae bacterium]MCC0048594.1 biopolymer transporter ExbD [Rhodobiaceae bacterium]